MTLLAEFAVFFGLSFLFSMETFIWLFFIFLGFDLFAFTLHKKNAFLQRVVLLLRPSTGFLRKLEIYGFSILGILAFLLVHQEKTHGITVNLLMAFTLTALLRGFTNSLAFSQRVVLKKRKRRGSRNNKNPLRLRKNHAE